MYDKLDKRKLTQLHNLHKAPSLRHTAWISSVLCLPHSHPCRMNTAEAPGKHMMPLHKSKMTDSRQPLLNDYTHSTL